jgi:hypothetical protein
MLRVNTPERLSQVMPRLHSPIPPQELAPEPPDSMTWSCHRKDMVNLAIISRYREVAQVADEFQSHAIPVVMCAQSAATLAHTSRKTTLALDISSEAHSNALSSANRSSTSLLCITCSIQNCPSYSADPRFGSRMKISNTSGTTRIADAVSPLGLYAPR